MGSNEVARVCDEVGVAGIQPMSKLQIGLAVIRAVLSVTAIVVCIYAVLFNSRLDVALIAGIILLGLAQLLGLFTRPGAKRDDSTGIRDLMTANNSLGQEQSLLRRRMDRMESAMASGHTAAAEQLDSQVRALEHSVSALTRQHVAPEVRDRNAAPVRNETPDLNEPTFADPPLRTEPTFNNAAGPREVDLFLEPIVRLSENSTAYYRATLSVRQGDGERLPLSRVAREAERGGYLSELDLTVFKRAVPVIRRLQNNGRNVAVFCPVNASSFADEGFMQSLLALLDANADIAVSMVIEITHTTLSQLSDRGQEGLAHLAQLGATFALSDVRGDVPDLVTLRELGFAFIAADVRLLVALKNESQLAADTLFDQTARSQLQLIAADVVKQSELAWIEDVVPLAYGAHFSPPRLVRHDITEQQEHAKVA